MPRGSPLTTILKLLIVGFWGLMLFLLIERVYLAPEMPAAVPDSIPDSETWMSVYFQGQKAGYSVQSLTRIETGYVVDQKTYLKLKLMGQVQELRTVTSANLSKAMGLRYFSFFMSAGPVRYQLAGTVEDRVLELTSMTAGHKTKSRLALDEAPRLAAGLMPFLVQKGLEKGVRFKVPIFDPSTLSTRPVQVVVEDRETLMIEGEAVETWRVRQDYFDTHSYTWLDMTGQSVKEEGLLGLSLVRTTAEKAREGIAGQAELADVVAATSAPTNRTLDHPREVRHLRARLKGVDLQGFELDGGRQRLSGDVVEVVRERIDVRDEAWAAAQDPLFAPDLAPTEFIQSRHPKILAQARHLTAGVRSPLAAIEGVVNWVYRELEKRPTMSVPNALEVLASRVGDCNEHAVLAAALLRAARIPTRVAVGVLYFEGRFYYHAWLEVYWGRWMAVDPLLGQIPADAAHIRFLTGGLSRQTEMVRLIGRLEVEILDAQ